MTNSLATKQTWPDILRALATLAVIILHTASPILNQFETIPVTSWHIGNIYDSLTRFCVPVFFMLSGALLLSKDYSLKDFLSKRFLRIIPPLIFWSLIYIVYTIFDSNKTFSSFLDLSLFVLLKLFKGSQFHLWFIYTLLGLYLLVPILRKWIKNASKNEILYFLLIWICTIIYAIPHLNDYLPKINLMNFSGYLGYMVLGYYLSNMKSFKKSKSFLLYSIGVIVTILGTYYLTSKNGAFNSTFYGYLTPNVLLSSTGIFLLIKEIHITSSIVKLMVSKISKYSYGIYLVHILVLELLLKLGLNWQITNPVISIPVIAILTILISWLIIYLGNKIKFLSRLVG